jgi:UDP-2,3-diacylglucosamine hydrolase
VATLGLIAGSGRFPLLLAESARAAGHRVVAVGHQGQTDPALEKLVDSLTWVKLGQIGKIVESLKSGGAEGVILLGAIAKTKFLRDTWFDGLGIKLLAQVAVRSDDNLLRTFARFLEKEGLPVLDATPYLSDRLAPAGVLGKHQPTEEQWADARYGLELARAIGRLDLGQTVVVKERVGVAVEGVEGTDACILRGGELAREAVVVKVVKPGQDRRFDLPAVGPDTVEVMQQAGCKVLAVEAGTTLVMDLQEMVRRAAKARIAVVGLG